MKRIISLFLVIVTLLTLTSCSNKDLPMEISQDDWLGSKKLVKLSTGIEMAYVEMGDPDGKVVILQHGMTDNSRSWSLAAPFFAKAGYHVYIPDLRGMGKSEAPDGYYTTVTYATDMEAFFDAMNIEKAYVVGHSLGSFTVQTFAMMFPERCEKLVLVSSAPQKNYINPRLMTLYEKFIEPLEEDGYPADDFMEMWYATVLQEEEFRDEFDTFLSYMKKEAQGISKKTWENILFGMLDMNLEDLYGMFDESIPVLVLHGDDDSMAKNEYQDELCELLNVKDDSFVNYEGIGHNIQFEMPKKCATDIITWFETGSLPKES